jgi:hypothetical protein
LPQIDEEAMNAARLTRRWQEAAGDPARMAEALVDEIDDPATGLVSRDFLRAELAQVREEIVTLRGELSSEIAGLRGELSSEIASLRGELRSEVASLRGELRSEVAGLRGELRSEVAGLRTEIAGVKGDIWRIVLTAFGAQIALVGIMVTILVQVLR